LSSASPGGPGIGSLPPSTGRPTQSSGGGSGTGNTPQYPVAATDYTRAVLDAWDAHNSGRIAALSGPGGVVSFANLGNPDRHWHFHVCLPDGDRRACTYDNNNGDRISIDVDPTLMGKPHAVVSAFIDHTEYGNSADSVVGTFMQAWADGNKYRMVSVADNAAVTYAMATMATPESWTLNDAAGVAGHTTVNVSTNNGPLVFDVTNARLGHPHSFTHATG
jgi:hypothetical protein